MKHSVGVENESGRIPLSRAQVEAIATAVLRAERVRQAVVCVIFISNHAMTKLNRLHFGHRRPTDVIAFGFNPIPGFDPLMGNVYIAPDVAREHARLLGITVREELARLIIHGMLHVVGRDHSAGEAERLESPMWRRQEQLLARVMRRIA